MLDVVTPSLYTAIQRAETSDTTTLCIPRMELRFTPEYVSDVISKLHLGEIENVTEIPLKNDPTHKRIMLKIRWNPTNEKTEKIKARLMKKEPVQVVYDGKWYWKLMISKGFL